MKYNVKVHVQGNKSNDIDFAEAPSQRLGDGFVAIVGELAHLADIASVSRWRATRAAGAPVDVYE